MATSTIMRGTMILTAGIFITKFLGMLYVIPFAWLVGETGAALYFYAYNPYNILLSISIVGVPKAVSKFVAKYNALGDYRTSRKMFKAGIMLMAGTGLAGFMILFFSAEFLAEKMLVDGDATGNSIEDVKLVIQMVSFALILIPGMSIVRGFFQGNESMGPTAVSQLVEQIARIIFLLVGAYFIIKVFHGSIALAVGFATFAAFIGAVASCFVLYAYWRKRKKHLDKLIEQQTFSNNFPTKDMFKELFRYAGPFVLVGIATSLYQLVDQFTFTRTMVAIGHTQIYAERVLGSFNLLSHKLVIIPVTLSIGLSLAMLPAITKAFTEKNRDVMFKQMNQSFQVIMLFVVPAVIGLILLSNEAYGSLYGLDNVEVYGALLAWYAPVGIFFSFFTVSSNVLQGIDKQNFTVISLSVGLLLKILLNVPFIRLFEAKGAILATLIAVAAVVLLNMWKIKKSVAFSYSELLKRTVLISLLSTVMGLVVWTVKWLLGFFIHYTDGRIEALIVLIICVLAGVVTYLGLCYKFNLLEKIVGRRIPILDRGLQLLKKRKKHEGA